MSNKLSRRERERIARKQKRAVDKLLSKDYADEDKVTEELKRLVMLRRISHYSDKSR